MEHISATRNPFARPGVLRAAIILAALGYFVDIYDLILFGVVRKVSLIGIGVTGDEAIKNVGTHILDMQMTGMLIGGILWGILGDKKGRLSVLFGSILMYSLANIANGFVNDPELYAWLRLLAGIGLAGELGAGITLVSEMMPKEKRGYGTTIIATVGVTGAVAAALVGSAVHWRTAYFIGGFLGLALLALRISVSESGMFKGVLENKTASRGNFLALFTSSGRLIRYLKSLLIATPTWYVIGILVAFSPELGKAMGLTPEPVAGTALMYAYIGLAAGDLASGLISQWLKSRRKAIGLFVLMTGGSLAAYFTIGGHSLQTFYLVCLALGLSAGYWAVFVTTAAEQFGTNLRATVTTTAPNFARGMLVIHTWLWRMLSGHPATPQDSLRAAMYIGIGALVVAFAAVWFLDETFGKDLDYTEDV